MQRAGESLGLDVWSPDTVNSPESQARLASLAPDLWSCATTAKSCAPKRWPPRGSAASTCTARCCPSTAALRRCNGRSCNGEAETGNSVIQMTPGLDAGPCLGQQRTPIDPDEDAEPTRSAAGRDGCGAGRARGRRAGRRHVAADRAGSQPGVEGAAAQEGGRRDRLVAIGAGDQRPGASSSTLAAGGYVLASRGG